MSTWTFTCVNHPHLRWTKNKCGPGFIGGGVLIFEGDAERMASGGPFPMSQRRIDLLLFAGFLGDEGARKYAEDYLSRYVAECNCPMSDLRVHAKEYQPIPSYPLTQMTPEQFETFDAWITHTAEAPANHHSQVLGEMFDGNLHVYLSEDGVTRCAAIYDRAGELIYF